MKVELNTKDKTVYVDANDIAQELAKIDEWIKVLQVARAWLKKALEA
jgi:hypothetical protein